MTGTENNTDAVGGPVLIYRDRLGARSEVEFLRRQYVGFRRLPVVWLCRHREAGAEALGGHVVRLGRAGLRGVFDRALFKFFGTVPPQPDLAALRPQVLHAQFGRGGALALPLARALGIPLVVTMHGGDATKDKHYRRGLFPSIYQRRFAALLRETALFICVSAYIRDVLVKRGFPADKLIVNHCGVEAPNEALQQDNECSDYFLFVGRFVAKKGIEVLIEAMRILAQAGVSPPVMLIGDGPLALALKRQAQGLGNVRFLGWLPNRDVQRYMRGARAVCVPSVAAESGDSDGLPTVLLEAMALGVPVIASRHAGIPEAVDHGRDGVLVPPGDPKALAAALRAVIDDPAGARAMGEAGRRKVRDQFSATEQSHRLEATLVSVIAVSRNPMSDGSRRISGHAAGSAQA